MSSKLESDVCCRLQVAPSGESYQGKRSLAESNGRLLLGIWRDSLHVTCGLTACTPGSALGPTLGNEYGKTLPFFSHFDLEPCFTSIQNRWYGICVAVAPGSTILNASASGRDADFPGSRGSGVSGT